MTRGRQAGGSRFGTFLVLAGIAGVLSVTFVAGVWTGRHWPLLTAAPKPPAPVDAVTGKRVADERPRPTTGALPSLTFYQELKAPLTAPPPPPKPAKSPRPPDLAVPATASSVAATPPAAAPPRPEPAALPESTRSESAAIRSESSAQLGTRFTLQVGAYTARPPADTLRAMLAASGHDARVVEAADTRGGVRYRVQVGVFDSREAAQEAKARLANERALQSFVTTR
jgi:cell division protein FtsN